MVKKQQAAQEESEKHETHSGANSNVGDEGVEESGSVVEFSEAEDEEDAEEPEDESVCPSPKLNFPFSTAPPPSFFLSFLVHFVFCSCFLLIIFFFLF